MEWELVGCLCVVVTITQMFTQYVLGIVDPIIHFYIFILPILMYIAMKILNWIGNKYDEDPSGVV